MWYKTKRKYNGWGSAELHAMVEIVYDKWWNMPVEVWNGICDEHMNEFLTYWTPPNRDGVKRREQTRTRE